MSNRVPKIILKSLYESFRTTDEASAREKLALVDGLDVEEGLALAHIAAKSSNFQDFARLVNGAGTEDKNGPLSAARRLALFAAKESSFPWESEEKSLEEAAPVG